jgi:VWFA-related protein
MKLLASRVVFAAVLIAVAGGAQELPGARISPMTPGRGIPPAGHPAGRGAAPQIPTIVANTNLVNMVFSVEGKHKAFLPDLTRNDFRVLEDGRPQRIRFFSLEDQLPLTLGLLLDTSPSQAGVLGEEQSISDEFFRQVITPKDLAFVVGFDVNTTLLQDLTSSPELLSHAVNRAQIGGTDASSIGILNPGPFPSAGPQGATHLWDAIYLACHDELAHQVGRKAIIVVTDGGEQGSTYTHLDALRAALDSNTVVFAVIAYDRRFSGYGFGGMGPGPGQLRQIAQETGGRTINAGKNLQPAFALIERELRSQYTLGYQSDRQNFNGKFRRVQIELTGAAKKQHPGAKVRARSGYFAVAPGH